MALSLPGKGEYIAGEHLKTVKNLPAMQATRV